jgi:hypothetical protein
VKTVKQFKYSKIEKFKKFRKINFKDLGFFTHNSKKKIVKNKSPSEPGFFILFWSPLIPQHQPSWSPAQAANSPCASAANSPCAPAAIKSL